MNLGRVVCMAVSVWLLLPILSGCTDADLECSPEWCRVEPPVVTLKGKACTAEPRPVLYPYKILFVIDVSGSNKSTDPGNDRSRAAGEIVTRFIENRAVSFGAMTFSGTTNAASGATVQDLTKGFTRNRELLQSVVLPAFTNALGGTPYQPALVQAYEFILADIQATKEDPKQGPGMLPRTRYDIQWLSDGQPTDGTNRSTAIDAVSKIRRLRGDYDLFDLRLSTVQLTGDGGGDSNAKEILRAMADEGGGTYAEMTAGNLEFDVRFTEIFRAFERRRFFIVNESRVVRGNEIYPDSDGDGLPDGEDPEPQHSDFDDDGCSDMVNDYLQTKQSICRDICQHELEDTGATRLEDEDNDGIPDCAEKAMGWKYGQIDSDRDGYDDKTELRFGTNGLTSNTAVEEDKDKDGVSDGFEIMFGTDPLSPEDEEERETVLAYKYSPLIPFADDDERPHEQMECFSFEVSNIRLVETISTERNRAGENIICAYISQTPVDEPDNQRTVTRACAKASYRHVDGKDVREPADGILTFAPEDFDIARIPR